MKELIPRILAYIEKCSYPLTSKRIAEVAGIEDHDLVSRTLASMNQRKTPLIARRSVKPGKQGGPRFEYMSLALAERLGVEVVPKSFAKPKATCIPDSPIPKGVINLDKPQDQDICDVAGIEAFAPNNAAKNTAGPPVIDDIPAPIRGVEALARLIGRRIARTMMQALQEEIEEQLDRMTTGLIETWVDEKAKPMIHRAEQRQEKARLHKVLIAGLVKPADAGRISEEFGEVFDLRFWLTDEGFPELKAKSAAADVLIAYTCSVGHKMTEHMSTSGKKINKCTGGLTMLRSMLTELYVGGKETV